MICLYSCSFVSEIVKFQLIGKMLLNSNPEGLVFKFLQMRTIEQYAQKRSQMVPKLHTLCYDFEI